MFFYLYKTTNKLNGKYYIGIHSTDNLDDGYLGSGKLLLRAIKKYGKSYFHKEVLYFFSSLEEMIEKEIQLVTKDFCQEDTNYNLMPGGLYGSKKTNGLTFLGCKHSEETKKKIRDSSIGKKVLEETKEKMRINNFARRKPEEQKLHAKEAGKKSRESFSLETREKLREFALNNSYGKGNRGKIRNKIACPQCGKLGSKNVMIRWHFDNCKNNSPIV